MESAEPELIELTVQIPRPLVIMIVREAIASDNDAKTRFENLNPDEARAAFVARYPCRSH